MKVNFIALDGITREVPAVAGETLMEVAVRGNVPGLLADCGGACSCGTCHVYVEPRFEGLFPPPEEHESGLLAFDPSARPNSRLACQMEVQEGCDGLVVRVAGSE